ncbi:hypothetical protein [Pseudacidovorax sp. NFM-22]|uniref:hypothetical protein n=1 Tax=Pseudacidovorax sp. NFM-22 TaxID=2744469 RepID=UPI001F247261|nr:hypothetical protein [Pseudacidovorax sp. NFM-22]
MAVFVDANIPVTAESIEAAISKSAASAYRSRSVLDGKAQTVIVVLPSGKYDINRPVSANGLDIIWKMDPGTAIGGLDRLPGTLYFDAKRIVSDTFGTEDSATGFSVIANPAEKSQQARVLGLTEAKKLAKYGSRDSVAFYAENTLKSPTVDASKYEVKYSKDGAQFTQEIDTRNLKAGMIVDTAHNPKWSGFLVSWSPHSIVVSGWYRAGGDEVSSVPTNDKGLYINPVTKIWAANLNVFLNDSSVPNSAGVREATALEIGVMDDSRIQVPTMAVGVDAIPLGRNGGKIAFWGRGPNARSVTGWDTTFLSWRHQTAGFKAQFGMDGSTNFHSVGVGEVESGRAENVGFFDYKSKTSVLLEPKLGGDAIVVRGPGETVKKFQLDAKGQMVFTLNKEDTPISVRSADNKRVLWAVDAKGRMTPINYKISLNNEKKYTVTESDGKIVCLTKCAFGIIQLPDSRDNAGREIEIINRSEGPVKIVALNGGLVDGKSAASVDSMRSARALSIGDMWVLP